MKDNIFGILPRAGRSLMLPAEILPAAGLLPGILQGNAMTSRMWILPAGIFCFFLFCIFSYLIRKFHHKTPGRKEKKEGSNLSAADMDETFNTEGISDDVWTRALEEIPDTASEDSIADALENALQEQNFLTNILSPMDGICVELSQVKDGVFSEKMLGPGAAIEPCDGRVYAPFDGRVKIIFDTRHALGLTCTNGIELLIHIGIGTVNLKGRYYKMHVREGASVKTGELLAEFDMAAIRSEGYRLITPVVVTNADSFHSCTLVRTGAIRHGDTFLSVR